MRTRVPCSSRDLKTFHVLAFSPSHTHSGRPLCTRKKKRFKRDPGSVVHRTRQSKRPARLPRPRSRYQCDKSGLKGHRTDDQGTSLSREGQTGGHAATACALHHSLHCTPYQRRPSARLFHRVSTADRHP